MKGGGITVKSKYCTVLVTLPTPYPLGSDKHVDLTINQPENKYWILACQHSPPLILRGSFTTLFIT